ncbi:MAG: B-4DMT family transporter [Mycolicibacterium hassiacum]|jgi:hypothetical protein|nr:MAG: hypothetical protein DIU75_22925 [Mycolicibacterium hassiacum]
MNKWLLRGLVFAALMVILRLLQTVLINFLERYALAISVGLVIIYALVALIWGVVDGVRDARANPDPDRRADLAMTWLLAGLFAGVVSGAVTWVIGRFYKSLYVETLLSEVTTFAAFTALLLFLCGIAGVGLGRRQVDRKADPMPHLHRARGDQADTDVFAAVSNGSDQT